MKECLRMLNIAISQDSSIVSSRDAYLSHPGNEEAYLDSLGLTRRHLKKLEKLGYAIRGYTKNIWLPGEEAPDGKPVHEHMSARGKGHRVKWLLFGVNK